LQAKKNFRSESSAADPLGLETNSTNQADAIAHRATQAVMLNYFIIYYDN
jgi:hypothetical protein